MFSSLFGALLLRLLPEATAASAAATVACVAGVVAGKFTLASFNSYVLRLDFRPLVGSVGNSVSPMSNVVFRT